MGTGLLPLGISESTDSNDSGSTGSKDTERITTAKKYVERIRKAMAEGTMALKKLSGKTSFDKAKGEKNHNQISYAAMHLFGVRNFR